VESPTILIVEDNPTTRTMLRVMLELEGYHVLEARDARTGLARARNDAPDLILQDLMLPDMDGLKLMKELRALPRGETPIVCLSGFSRQLEESRSQKEGFNACLEKPVQPAFLLETIRRLLPNQSAALADETESPGQGRHILIAGSDPVQIKLARRHFQDLGFRVRTAASGAAALDLARTKPPEVLLSDAQMPDLDGFDLCMAIRRDPQLTDVPVVLMSAPGRQEGDERDLALRVGANAFAVRTPSFHEVSRAVLTTLEASAASPQADDATHERRKELTDRVLRQLKRQVAVNAELTQRCALQEAQLAILGGAADALTRSADIEIVLGDLLPACLDAGGITRGALYRRDSSEKLAQNHAIGFPDAGPLEAAFIDLLERVVAGKVATTSASLPEADAHTLLTRVGAATGLIVPLVGNTHGLGALVLGSDTVGVAEQDLLAFGRAIGAYMSQALALARVFARLDEANRTRDEFLATVSHELRTPLNAILGWTSILRSGPYDSAQLDKGLATIERNGKAQVRLIEDILDVSRIITGKLGLKFERVVMVPVVRAAIDVLLPAANAKGVQIVAMLDPETNPIEGDADRLRQVIWNLLSNAVKFTPRGGRIEVRLERRESSIEIRVTDTGRGIRAEFLPHIFERFRQADGSTTRGHGGLGLGMAIARHLVELHGGSIRAESPGEGKGATFIVELPVRAVMTERRVEDTKPGGIAARVPIARVLLRGVKVLVVDDEADARDLVQVLLAHEGAEVRLAASAEEAIEALKEFPAQVLVSDIGMSGEDGYELLQGVRALTSRTKEWIPAVALTAYARASDVEAALNAGFQKHMAKPVEPAELVKTIATLARQAQRIRS
jgi:CheY-like chemotaxis protein